MKPLQILAVVLCFVSLASSAPRAAMPGGPVTPATLEDAKKQLGIAMNELPLLGGFPIDKLRSEPDGFYYARDVQLLGNTMTIAVYVPKGKTRLDVAVMMGNISIGSLVQGLGETPLDVIQLRNPVVIYSPGVRDTTMGEKLLLADLPAEVANRVKKSADVLYLRKGLNLTSQVEPTGSLGEAVDLLTNIGIDLKDLVIQSSFGKGKSILLRRRGEWSNPFQLKNSKITDATVYLLKKGDTKSLACWGGAKVGSTDVYLYAERVTKGKTPMGDAYGLNGSKVTMKVLVDFIQAIPFEPAFPTAGLSALPLDQLQIKNTAYVAPPEGGGIPDVSKFIAFAATTPAVRTPDNQTSGPRLVAHGDAVLFKYDMANLLLDASIKGVTAAASIASFELAEVKMKSAKFFLGPKSGTDLKSYTMSISGGINAFGLANQDVEMFISSDQYSFSTSFGLKGIGDATLNAQTGHKYSLPWDVSLDVSGGVAGKIFDAGLDTYEAVKKNLPKELKVLEPDDLTSSLRLHSLVKNETWKDLGNSAGEVLSDPKGTVTAVSKSGYTKMKQIAKEAGKTSEDLLNRVEKGSMKAASTIAGWLGIHHGSSSSKQQVKTTKRTTLNSQRKVDEMVWGIQIVPNYAYKAKTSPSAGNEEPGFPSSNAVDGMDLDQFSSSKTSFISKELVRPKWELDLDPVWKHLMAIVIKVPDDDTIGLQGAVVAVARHHRGQGWFENPPSPDIHFYPIKERATYYVIKPSNAVSAYAEERASMKKTAQHIMQDPGNASWVDMFRRQESTAIYYMLEIRDIAIFRPGKGRIAISEVAAFRAEDLELDPIADYDVIE